jgi:hypothetical protein
LTLEITPRIIHLMRELPPVLIEIAHYWAWLLRTGSMEYEETLEPNSAVLVWFTDDAVLTPPSSADDWNEVIMQEVVYLSASLVSPLWRDKKSRTELLERFAEVLAVGDSIGRSQQPADLIVHLVDTPASTAGMKAGFEIWIHCAQGTFVSVTTLGLDVKSQIALAPDAALKVEGAVAIDGYLSRYQ